MNKDDFLGRIKQVSQKDTSADPDGWTENNPLWGHCAVVSLLAQDVFGGTLTRGSLKEHAKYGYLRSHFWNRLPNGEVEDFTAEQYTDLSFSELHGEERSREDVLSYPDTLRRYTLLKERFDFVGVSK